MSRWFRWYEGTTEDGKFRVVARMSRVTVRDVIALWAFMLEDAAHLDHRGVCERNEDFMSACLDFEDGVVEHILSAMEDVGMISVGHGAITICKFKERQFDSDTDPTAADRQRRKRERDKQTNNAPVTEPSRVTHAAQITDSDSETDKGFNSSSNGKKAETDAMSARLASALKPAEKKGYMTLKATDSRRPNAEAWWFDNFGTRDLPWQANGKGMVCRVPWEAVRFPIPPPSQSSSEFIPTPPRNAA